jgi:hypothetical protein
MKSNAYISKQTPINIPGFIFVAVGDAYLYKADTIDLEFLKH